MISVAVSVLDVPAGACCFVGGALLCAALLAMVLVVDGGRAAADSWPTDPANPATPVTVSADGLPTAQINGVVWSQTVVGDIVLRLL